MNIKEQLIEHASALLQETPAKLANKIGVNYLSLKLRGKIPPGKPQLQALDRLNNYLLVHGYKISIVEIDGDPKPDTFVNFTASQDLSEYWEQSQNKATSDAN